MAHDMLDRLYRTSQRTLERRGRRRRRYQDGKRTRLAEGEEFTNKSGRSFKKFTDRKNRYPVSPPSNTISVCLADLLEDLSFWDLIIDIERLSLTKSASETRISAREQLAKRPSPSTRHVRSACLRCPPLLAEPAYPKIKKKT